MSATCPVCQARQDAGLVCSACCDRLERDLADVGDLIAELDATLARQARIGSGGRAGLASEMNPWQQGASITLSTLTNTLTTWARDVCDSEWHAAPSAHPAQAAAGYLLLSITEIRRHPAADELVDEISYAVSVARRQVDRTARRFPVGPCPEQDEDGADCPGEVWAFLPVEDDRPSKMECRANGEHAWTSIQWLRVGKRMLDKIERQKRTGTAA